MIKLFDILQEITGKPKAIFLAGPAGSGKTYTLNQLLPVEKYQVINVDDTYEELLKSSGLGTNLKDFGPEELSQAAKLMGRAQGATKEKYAKALEGLNNVIIDGTGAAFKPLLKKKAELEALGYETMMLMLYVSPMTSLKRNAERERSLLPQIVLRTWRDTNKNIDLYRQEFGDRFILINNDPEDTNKTFDPAEVKKLYFDTAKFSGKPKTPEEQAKSKADAEQLNQDIISLVKQIPQTDTLDSAKSKIAMLAEGNQQYKVYCDMDGVIVDFEHGYDRLTGRKAPGVNSTYDKTDFWGAITKAGKDFWADLEWMEDGKQLWNYIKQYNPKLLTAPSREESSRIGKKEWVDKNLPGTPIIFKQAKDKKDLAEPNTILIDDREDNIQQWIDAGGIGIRHTSTASTIKQLQKLGL
jgi:predicted kinase/FMN phosphatase YigB (HAD superfamily)